MGLLVKLQNGETALKSLKFGKDRLGGGDSGQPYIQNPIIDEPGKLSQADNDFLLRGGLRAPINAIEDVARLTKYMFNLKNPSGLLFIAKQNLLSRVAVPNEAAQKWGANSPGAGYAGGALNEGVYTPLSTLAQAGVGFLGIHLNKQGIDPTGLLPSLSIKKYEEVASKKNQPEFNKLTLNFPIGTVNLANSLVSNPLIPGLNPFAQTNNLQVNINETSNIANFSNRLLNLWYNKKSTFDPNDLIILEYDGGPGSILGIGKTRIRFATDRNGYVLKTGQFPTSNLFPTVNENYSTWSSKDFIEVDSLEKGKIKNDFRNKLTTQDTPSTFLSVSKGYSTFNNVETNFNLGNPGKKGDVSNFYLGKNKSLDPSNAADKVNASYIYKSNQGSRAATNPDLKDIIPFSIAILNNENQQGGPWKKYMHFRAFIDSFSDSYDAEWKSIEYMGRAEKFYKYGGFDRKISLAFTVVAQSKNEITGMYDKLNFLASSLAPEYLDSYASGYMAGNIAYLTLGEYIVEQPGIITSITYDIPEESSWDIGIDPNGDLIPGATRQRTTRQVPFMIKVTGFNFIPLHKFRVEKQTFLNDKLGTDSDRLLATGNHRYIDQARPQTTNYDEDRIKNDYDKINLQTNLNSLQL